MGAPACAPAALRFPTGAATPLPEFHDVHSEVTRHCRGVRTFTAELALAGRSSGERLRGRVVAGFAEPDAMRLEGVAPFGAPVFVLVSRAGASTLLLPRESSVLTGEAPDTVLAALTGIALGPRDLRALLTGCVTDAPVAGGASFAGGWASLRFTDDTTMFLRRNRGRWVVRGGHRAGWQVEFPGRAGTFPSEMRLRSADTDLLVQVRQVEANVTLEPDAFTVVVPPGTRPVTLDDIRRAGTLKETP